MEIFKRWGVPIGIIIVGWFGVMFMDERGQHAGLFNAILGVGIYIVKYFDEE